MRLSQGAFSFLPDLTDPQITSQVQYCLHRGWAVSIEHTADPHPRNTYWEMWGQPMFDLVSTDPVMDELARCRQQCVDEHIRLSGFDSTKGWESVRLSFLVHRPQHEHDFEMTRVESPGRQQRYAIRTRTADSA